MSANYGHLFGQEIPLGVFFVSEGFGLTWTIRVCISSIHKFNLFAITVTLFWRVWSRENGASSLNALTLIK